MNELKLTLPIPVSVNHCYGMRTTSIRTRRGFRNIPIRYTTTDAKKWKENAGSIAMEQMNKTKFNFICDEQFFMQIRVWWLDLRHGDCSNTLKLLEDSLQGIVFNNDKNCLPQFLSSEIDKENPRLELSIFRKEDSSV